MGTPNADEKNQFFWPLVKKSSNTPVYLPTTASSSGDDTETNRQKEDVKACKC